MSDDDSFVILGSSPPPSLELDGSDEHRSCDEHKSPSTSPGSHFSSLDQDQLKELHSAVNTSPETTEPKAVKLTSLNQESTTETLTLSSQKQDIRSSSEVEKSSSPANISSSKTADNDNEIKLWSRPPQIVDKSIEEKLCLNLEDCAIKSPLSSSKPENENLDVLQKDAANTKQNSNEHLSGSSASTNSSLASSFILGNINADVLKSSVYTQFSSISLHSSPEEVVKLQNIITENLQLKAILEQCNNTMRLFHTSSLQWHEKMNNMETKHKEELDDCQKEIEMLRKENQILQENFKTQIEAIEIARQKDREETIKEISEKNSLLENMRAEIVKLEKQHLASFEVLAKNDEDKYNFSYYYIPREEHEAKMKDVEKKLSELYASNLDLKDLEKQYIDELNCLKVNLTSAEELIKRNRDTIAGLRDDVEEQAGNFYRCTHAIQKLTSENAEQKERIVLLEQQNEVYRKDFLMEQESRSLAVKEKQRLLQDLKTLQNHNQELIQEHQKHVNNCEKRLNLAMNQSLISTAAPAQTYINNPQRPIRQLPSTTSSTAPKFFSNVLHHCPLCNKAFKSLSILQSHVNDCIDKN